MRPRLEATEGYQALWPVLGLPILLVIPLVARLIPAESAADRASGAEEREAPHGGVDDVDDRAGA